MKHATLVNKLRTLTSRLCFRTRKAGSCKGQILEMRDMRVVFLRLKANYLKNKSRDPTFLFQNWVVLPEINLLVKF